MTKDQLRRYYQLKKESRQIRDELKALETAMYYPKIPRITGMPSAPSNGNHTEALIVRHQELLERYCAKLVEMEAEQLAVEQAIDALDPMERMLMRYRYLDGLKWEEVCVKMGYSWRQTHRAHAKALEQLKAKNG